jgi:hypothetical protein
LDRVTLHIKLKQAVSCCLRWLNSCVNLTWVAQRLRSALSTGPNWVRVFPPIPEDGNRSSFRNVVFSSS